MDIVASKGIAFGVGVTVIANQWLIQRSRCPRMEPSIISLANLNSWAKLIQLALLTKSNISLGPSAPTSSKCGLQEIVSQIIRERERESIKQNYAASWSSHFREISVVKQSELSFPRQAKWWNHTKSSMHYHRGIGIGFFLPSGLLDTSAKMSKQITEKLFFL